MAGIPDYAAQIRAIMARLGMTDDEFAHAIRMSPSGLKKIINKPFQTPKAHNIQNINAIAPPELRIRLDPGAPGPQAMDASPQVKDRLEKLQALLSKWAELTDEERDAALAIFRLTTRP